jgi:hypothetical protein
LACGLWHSFSFNLIKQWIVLSSSEQPTMQVHEDPVSDLSVRLEHTLSLAVQPLKLDIPDQAIREASKKLERHIDLDDKDDLILHQLWLNAHWTLSQYPRISESIANEEEFKAKVKRQGKEEFLELVKDSARRNSWRDLLHNGISPPLTTSSFFILSVQTCL